MGTLDIDLRDPSVRRFLDGDDSRVATGNGKRRMEQLAGDAPANWHGELGAADPLAGVRRTEGQRGMLSTTRLDQGKIEVLVAYRGRIGQFDLTIDVYRVPGAPLELHIICPKCRNKSRISGEKKKIAFDERITRPYEFVDGSRFPTNGGRLDVEPFECAWELDNKAQHVQGLRAGGINLCRMRLAIDGSIAKDA